VSYVTQEFMTVACN